MTSTSPARPMTLTEKILLHHAVGWHRPYVAPGDAVSVTVDWTLASEIAWKGMDKTYEALGRPPLHDPERFYLALDHTVDKGTLANDPRVQGLVQLSRGFAREARLKYFYDANQTIMHTEFFRQLVRPGDVVVGADSHTSSHGGMAAFAVGLGGADVVSAMVRGSTWIQVPEAIRVHYRGALPFGLTGKDAVLRTLGQLGRNTVAMERTVEYTGDRLEAFSTDFRFSVANMTAELGGLNGLFPADGRVAQTMEGRRAEEFRRGGLWFAADEDAVYAESFVVDLEAMPPQVAKPYSPDNVAAVDEVTGQPLDGCFIGACTTSEEELVLAACVLERALERGGPKESANRLVVPGSLAITERLAERGLLEIYRRAGFRIGEPGCSMCIGIGSDRAQPGEVWLSSQNRNFHNRMGKGSIAWLSSALTVAASALELEIADPRPFVDELDRDRIARLLSPAAGLPAIVHEQPHTRPVAAGTPVPGSRSLASGGPVRGRVQIFGDNVDTDAMIPAEFCHLTDLGELGAKAFTYVRPDFVARVAAGEDVVVAGEGWGTGSSREHAVWALQGAGVRAIVAKSVAFIHKRNLVNEALPFILLDDEEFYRSVADGDEIEVDPVTATVQVAGKTYRGQGLAAAMRGIVDDGGLVPYVRQRLAVPALEGGSAERRVAEASLTA